MSQQMTRPAYMWRPLSFYFPTMIFDLTFSTF